MGEVIACDGVDQGRVCRGRWDMSPLGRRRRPAAPVGALGRSVNEAADAEYSATAHSLGRNRREGVSWWALDFLYPCGCP